MVVNMTIDPHELPYRSLHGENNYNFVNMISINGTSQTEEMIRSLLFCSIGKMIFVYPSAN